MFTVSGVSFSAIYDRYIKEETQEIGSVQILAGLTIITEKKVWVFLPNFFVSCQTCLNDPIDISYFALTIFPVVCKLPTVKV